MIAKPERVRRMSKPFNFITEYETEPFCRISDRQYPQATGALIAENLQELVQSHPSIGFWMCYHRLRMKGFNWNHKRVYRMYCQMQLNIRRRARKRLPARVKQTLYRPESANKVWSVDFMSDSLWDGRKFRLPNIIDDYNREVLSIEADTSFQL